MPITLPFELPRPDIRYPMFWNAGSGMDIILLIKITFEVPIVRRQESEVLDTENVSTQERPQPLDSCQILYHLS